ncbi:hypothetical protein SAMN06265379_10189 [Saccharicrinis carchari]|uniref:Uncharacterized protein n=1 Tax=Saccharicrinis carchari TaxID=1168039 RepID=A0A521AEP8_SACCC|nr:hypothetical protein SAMN06265379_10189 [Saccharicrinis carchari]
MAYSQSVCAFVQNQDFTNLIDLLKGLTNLNFYLYNSLFFSTTE